jgi:phage tail tape-measure protein
MANTTVDTLLVRIETDLSGLKRGLNQVQRNVATAGDKSADAFRSMEGGINRATGAAAKLGGAILAAVGTAALGGSILGTIRQFEDLEAQLKSVTPDIETAGAAFQLIQQFAATTPFQLQEVTQAFITLASAGIAPTSDVLQDLGNLAAARGKNIQDVAQAVLNATTGEFEMLKSLGIVVRTEGDTITATFNGVSQTMQKSGIVDYLRQIGREKFGDALANQSNTLSGRISNLGDAMARFQVQIGEAGLKDAVMDLLGTFLEAAENGENLATTIGRSLATAVRGLNTVIIFLRDNMTEITRAVIIFFAVFAVAKVIAIAGAVITLVRQLNILRQTMDLLNEVTKKNRLLLIASVLAAIGSQMGVLDRIMDSVNGKMEDNGEAAKKAERDLDDLNKLLNEKMGSAKAEQATKKYTDAINDMQTRVAAARLELQGFSKEQVAALKSAGLLENVDLTGAEVGFGGTKEERDELLHWARQIEGVSAATELTKIGKGLSESLATLNLGPVAREFQALFSPEVWAMVEKGRVSVDGLSASFMRLKQAQAVKEFTEDMADLRREFEMTDVERFAHRYTQALKGILPDDQIAKFREEAMVVFESGRAHQDRQQTIAAGVGVAQQFAGEELRIADAMTSVQAAFDAQKISTLDYLNATRALQGQLKMLNPIFQSIESVVQSATSTMTSALVAMFSGAEKAKDVFKNFFGGLANMILGEVMKMLIVVPIMNAIRAALGMPMVPQITPAMADAAGLGPSAYSLNQPGATAGFSQRAGGGAIMAGMPTLVGERGPELFVPHSAGKIVNGNNTASLMRQSPPVVVNQTVQVTTGVQNTVRAEIQNLLPQIAEVTKAAVQQSALRGGSFKRAFA